MCSLMPSPSLFVFKELYILRGSFAIILMGSWERKEMLYAPVSCLEPDTQTFWNEKDLGLHKLRHWSATWVLQTSDSSSKTQGWGALHHIGLVRTERDLICKVADTVSGTMFGKWHLSLSPGCNSCWFGHWFVHLLLQGTLKAGYHTQSLSIKGTRRSKLWVQSSQQSVPEPAVFLARCCFSWSGFPWS